MGGALIVINDWLFVIFGAILMALGSSLLLFTTGKKTNVTEFIVDTNKDLTGFKSWKFTFLTGLVISGYVLNLIGSVSTTITTNSPLYTTAFQQSYGNSYTFFY